MGLTETHRDSQSMSAIKHYGLVADIGGTNIRFGIVDLDDPSVPRVLVPETLNAGKYQDLPDAARSYVDALNISAPPSAVRSSGATLSISARTR